jgi:arylsulfatase A-like enzyme
VAALAPPRPKSNFLLITFDALSAEDMSLYGYTLPTTPNLDAFAGKSTVFTNFYAASTFTTSSIAAIMTGSYPSENHVYQVEGRVSAKESGKNLPHAMRAGGYTPGAFLSNPFAYYLVQSAKSEYDFLPEPIFQPGGLHNLWEATRPLHQDSGIGNRLDEYRDLERVWNSMGVLPESQSFRLRPAVSFGKGREILAQSPDGFSLWIHVMAPHFPYLPDVEDRGRFLPYDEQLTFQEEEGARWRPYYEPDQQGEVDRRRLLYDEYILSTDRAFGAFVAELEKDGILQNTTVIISADHGESFEGGVYQHESAYQTRPVIHIPLIIRTPGQQAGRRVAFTADHTALAPTILELAGQPIPDWMRGESLVKWLQGNGQGEGEGRAFTQFLQRNSVFKAPRHGTVGVIDGKSQHQYVLDLETQKGSLRPLKEAHIWNLDRTAENPALAQALREAIYLRFPDLVQKP